MPLLWKCGEDRYAITFPCGVSRQMLCQLMDDIWIFCSCSVQGWCKEDLFKKHTGGLLYLCFGSEDLLVALSEDNTQWNINEDDYMLYRSGKHDLFFHTYPELDYSRMEKLM